MIQTGLLSKQKLLITGLFCLCVSLPVQAELQQEQQNRIRHMIRHDCGACHGYTLKGGLGPALTADVLKDKSDDILVNIILHGVDGTPMPPWKNILNQQEVSWIVEELKTGLPDE